METVTCWTMPHAPVARRRAHGAELNSQRYDVIIRSRRNPWTVGGEKRVQPRVFTKSPPAGSQTRGIMGSMVFHLYETEDEIVDLVLRTFSSGFPHVEIWDTGSGDIILLGSMQPWKHRAGRCFGKVFAIERVRTDMKMIDIGSPETLMARQLASQRTGLPSPALARSRAICSRSWNYAAPRAFLHHGPGSRML